MVSVNEKCPDFKCVDEQGNVVTLDSLKGKKVVLYFYPKDDTSGCTKEACGFRDKMKAFTEKNTLIYGVSKDSAVSHQKFRTKYDLNFSLLVDGDGTVCEAFGAWVEKSMYGKKYMGIERSTFLIDENGILQKIWRKVKVDGHIEEVLSSL